MTAPLRMTSLNRIMARLIAGDELVEDRLHWPLARLMRHYKLTEAEGRQLQGMLANEEGADVDAPYDTPSLDPNGPWGEP